MREGGRPCTGESVFSCGSLILSCQIFVSLSCRGISQVVDVKLKASTSTSDLEFPNHLCGNFIYFGGVKYPSKGHFTLALEGP